MTELPILRHPLDTGFADGTSNGIDYNNLFVLGLHDHFSFLTSLGAWA
jgi:hypothetical protein